MRPLAFTLLMALSLAALAAPRAELWERWAENSPSKVAIDHAEWNDFLARNVKPGKDGINRVPYGSVSKRDRDLLKKYLEKLQKVTIERFNRGEQRAYWINLYNAATVNVVLDHYPVESILKIDISPGLFSKGPWKKKLLVVEGEKLSLDDIEHRILRPIWKDPRTHYSVNCASVGCPNLQPQAFTSGNLEALLDAAARQYVNNPRGARVDDGRLTVSSIYVWFKSDFDGSDAGVIAHLKQYAEPALARQLRGVHEVDDDEYDWSLNDAK